MSKLNPVTVTEATVGDAAFDGQRRRPVVAINGNGELVVCCRSTARKHGWKLEGALFQRSRSTKPAATPAAKPAATPAAKPAKVAVKKAARATDPANAVVVGGTLVDVGDLLATKK